MNILYSILYTYSLDIFTYMYKKSIWIQCTYCRCVSSRNVTYVICQTTWANSMELAFLDVNQQMEHWVFGYSSIQINIAILSTSWEMCVPPSGEKSSNISWIWIKNTQCSICWLVSKNASSVLLAQVLCGFRFEGYSTFPVSHKEILIIHYSDSEAYYILEIISQLRERPFNTGSGWENWELLDLFFLFFLLWRGLIFVQTLKGGGWIFVHASTGKHL